MLLKKTKRIVIRPNTKWYNKNIRDAKVVKRRLERKWRKSGKQTARTEYVKQCRYVSFLLTAAKTKILSNKIL